MRFAVGLLVLALHGALLYALWRARPSAMLEAPTPVFVRWMDTPTSTAKAQPRVLPSAPKQPDAPQPQSRAVMAVQVAATPSEARATLGEALAAPISTASPPLDATQASASPPSAGAAPVASDLVLSCPVRAAPIYPLIARKMGETGSVLLRVELDEAGGLVSSEVARSSGFSRLDQAALAAVKSWRCHPALRDGQAVRVVSMESFEFKLKSEGY